MSPRCTSRVHSAAGAANSPSQASASVSQKAVATPTGFPWSRWPNATALATRAPEGAKVDVEQQQEDGDRRADRDQVAI